MSGAQDKIIGTSIYDIWPTENASTIKSRLDQVARTGQHQHHEGSYGGSVIDQYTYPAFGEDGKVNGFAIFATDITEKKRLDQALRESEEKYRRIVEMASEGIAILDEEMKIVFANRQLAGIFGFSPDKLAGQSGLEFLDEKNGQIVREAWQRRKPGITEHNVLEARGAGGQILWMNLATTAITDSEGRLAGTLCMITDITERKLMEETLQDSEQKMRSFINQSADGIILVDQDCRITLFNHSLEKITGLKSAEMIGQYIWDFTWKILVDERKPPGRYEELKAQVLQIFDKGDSPLFKQFGTIHIQRPDRTRKTLQTRLFPVRIGPKLMIGGIYRDVPSDDGSPGRL